MTTRFEGDVTFGGNVTVGGSLRPNLSRSSLAQDDLAVFPILFTDMRTHDALQTVLPGTSSGNDLALVGGTFGTDAPTLQTADLKAVGSATINYARFQVRLPAEYQAAETVSIRVACGMTTTVADQAATIDVEAFRVDKDNTISADLCTTAATDCNSLTFANKTFSITATTLSPGDVLDVRLALSVDDDETVTAVVGEIAAVDLLCDIKG